MQPSEVHHLFGEVQQAIGAHYGPTYQAQMAARGLDGTEWNTLYVALDFDPGPISAARWAVRNPYSAAHFQAGRLAALAGRGLLEETAPGTYRFTAAGRALAGEGLAIFEAAVRAVPALPDEAMRRLVALLGHLVEACLAAPEPPEKPCLVTNRHSDPGPDGLPLLRVMQYLADLNAFRDDTHLAAWRPYAVSGQAWEAFTLLWRDQAHTAAELAEKLSYRQHSAAAYAAALDELVQRGWIEADAGDAAVFHVTEQGRTLRQAVEDETDRTYYAPWAVFGPAELDELGGLLARLRDYLKETQPAPAN